MKIFDNQQKGKVPQKMAKMKNFCFHRNQYKKLHVRLKIYGDWCLNSREIANVLFLEHSIFRLIYTVNIPKYTHHWIGNELRILNLPQLKQLDHSVMSYDSFCQFQSSIVDKISKETKLISNQSCSAYQQIVFFLLIPKLCIF